jgi:predicted dehydrogenase
LVAGCFSRDHTNTLATGAELGIDPSRCYATFEGMLAGELALPLAERIQAVAIVTPNHMHRAPAVAFLDAGFHVICDKPLATSLEEAEAMVRSAKKSGCVFALTHNYTGYPMIREARERIAKGQIGVVRKVFAEYLQGWLSSDLESSGQKQAAWRTDPAQSGPTGALGDIGTHALNLLEHVTGLEVEALYAVMETKVAGRRLDDDDTVLLRMAEGATGVLLASQVCFGKENALTLRVFGTKGAMEWSQEHPNDLWVTEQDGVVRRIRTGTEATSSESRALTRTPPGHPEGYLEGFANVYAAFARTVAGKGRPDDVFPTVDDGLRGVRFLEACVRSSKQGTWISLSDSG